MGLADTQVYVIKGNSHMLKMFKHWIFQIETMVGSYDLSGLLVVEAPAFQNVWGDVKNTFPDNKFEVKR
jgi:hypothetical protein